MKKDVIVACDFKNGAETLAFLEQLPCNTFVKIGMELFYSEGPDIVRLLKKRGHRIFLDLKLHDIPNTVKSAMSVLSQLEVDLCNLHAAGGRAMMEAAIEGLRRADGNRPKLIAVTQLTSTDASMLKSELMIDAPMEEVVVRYAQNARAAGLDGVVCSPLEAPGVHKVCGSDFLTVTPGVRFPENDAGDQSRITTPERAAALGANLIVVGRPITRASDPEEAYRRMKAAFCGEESQ